MANLNTSPMRTSLSKMTLSDSSYGNSKRPLLPNGSIFKDIWNSRNQCVSTPRKDYSSIRTTRPPTWNAGKVPVSKPLIIARRKILASRDHGAADNRSIQVREQTFRLLWSSSIPAILLKKSLTSFLIRPPDIKLSYSKRSNVTGRPF